MGKHSDYKKIENYQNYYRTGSGLITFRKSINGVQRTIPTGTDSIKEARKIVDEKLLNLLSANPKAELRRRKGITNPLCRDIWADLVAERAVDSAEHTLENYQSSWKYSIEPFWGDRTVADVNHQNVTKFEAWYLKNRPTKSYFNVHKHLGMLFRYMKKHDLIREVPILKNLEETIIKNTRREVAGRVYTDAEVASMIENAVNERTQLCILIYRYMGPRKMEVLGSERSQWDVESGIAKLWSQKNGEWREIPIPDPVLGPLKSWLLKPSESKYMFPAERNPATHISSQVFDKDWTETKRLAKISKWNVRNGARIHDLRHTFATQTANENWPPMHACHVLDMVPKEYHRTYVHIKADDIKSLMKRSFSKPPEKSGKGEPPGGGE